VSYQVFARKYRPQVFDDILGQNHVVQTLKNAVEQQRLAHAYLFVGPRGTGKTSTARVLAKSLNCVHGPTVNPCGVCDSCREISQGISLDVLEIDGASNNSVDQVRELRENVRFAPIRGKFKIYIVDEVHMLTPQAFNALLKTLEEPPSHVKFVFATTEPHRVLPTILSRCQRFDLRRIPNQIIAKHLTFIAEKEGIHLDPDAAAAIAVAAEGGLRDAESMLDQLIAFCGDKIGEKEVLEVFGLTSEHVVVDLIRAILQQNASKALSVTHQQAEAGKDLSKLLADLLGFLRNLLVYQIDPQSLHEEVSEHARQALDEFAPLVSPEKLLRLIEQISEIESSMRWASNKKLHLEIALIRGIQTLGEVGLESVIDALEELRGSGSGSSSAPVSNDPTPPAQKSPRMAADSPPGVEIRRQALEARVPAEKSSDPTAATRPESLAESEPGPLHSLSITKAEMEELSEVEPASLESSWTRILHEVSNRRPLVLSWIENANPLTFEEGTLTLGFPKGQVIAIESLSRPGTKTFLEAICGEVLGQPCKLQFELKEGLKPVTRPPAPKPADPMEDFKNDPLIQKALELFRAEIQAEA
jgi:DNA polymerase III subunit gamma/tau